MASPSSSLKLEECGRVLISTDHRLIAIECLYCKELFTQWQDFVGHVKETHSPEFLMQEDNEECASILDVEFVENMPSEMAIDVPNSENTNAAIEESMESTPQIEVVQNYNPDATKPSIAQTEAVILKLLFETTKDNIFISFIEVLQQFPCLWTTPNDGSNLNLRHEALQAVSKVLNTHLETTQHCINCLLKWYQTEQEKRKNMSQDIESLYIGTHPYKNYAKYFELCSFLANSTLTNHKKRQKLKRASSDPISPLDCNFCGKNFAKRKYLDVHERRHKKDFIYKCAYCDKSTATSSELATHLRVHTGTRPYMCPICGKTFKTSSVLCHHQRKHAQPTIQCPLCPKAYYNNYQMKNHMNAHLNSRVYKCEFCDKNFTSAKILYAHKMNLHAELRKTFCTQCKKCFPNIYYHMHITHGIESAEKKL